MKNNKLIKIITTLVVIALLVLLFIFIKNNGSLTTKGVCDKLDKAIANKENFVLAIESSSSDEDDVLKNISKNYKNLKLINTKNESVINKECIKKVIKENALDNIKTDLGMAILYKNGTYVGMISDLTNYNNLENYLIQKEIIKKKEIKEKISFEKFKSNTKNEYIIFLVDTEENRKLLEKNVPKYFKEYKYDIANINSNDGGLIYKYVLEHNGESSLIMPQGTYFKNSKVVTTRDALNIEEELASFSEFVKKNK